MRKGPGLNRPFSTCAQLDTEGNEIIPSKTGSARCRIREEVHIPYLELHLLPSAQLESSGNEGQVDGDMTLLRGHHVGTCPRSPGGYIRLSTHVFTIFHSSGSAS